MIKKKNLIKTQWDKHYVGLNLNEDKEWVIESIYVNKLGDVTEATVVAKDKNRFLIQEEFRILCGKLMINSSVIEE